MKRSFAVLLTLIMVLSVLTACSADDTPHRAEGTNTTVTTATDNITATDGNNTNPAVDASTATPEDTGDTSAEGTTDNDDTVKKLMDNDDFTVVVTDYTQDSSGFTMNVNLTNKSSRDIEFSVVASAFNEKDVHPNFSEKVSAHSSVLVPMTWDSAELDKRSIKTVEEVKILLSAVAYEGEAEEVIASEILVFNP